MAANKTEELLLETYDGIREGTNKIPTAIAVLMALTIITAFLVTFPLWGQRTELNHEYWMLSYVHPLGGQPIDTVALAVHAAAEGQPLPVEIVEHTWGLTPEEENIFISVVKNTPDYDQATKDALLAKLEQKALIVKKTHISENHNQPWWDKGYALTGLYTLAFLVWTTAVISRVPTHKEF
ncbi:MAG: hypothetical protein HZA19_05755 [Nitrospirae bacterium]|nr:hypothetical protein [Nitrospirota bacterium]